jgi:Ni/Co efflux regulator RcnB
MWNDGFWARFAFVTPPAGVPRKKDRFPPGKRAIPPRLTTPIVQWHNRLGLPAVTLTDRTDDGGKPTGAKAVTIGPYQPIHYELGPGVFDAYYAYGDALGDILEENSLETTDFDGNYMRFPAKALRVALLLASMEGKGDVVEMRHWARGQEIAERWRVYLHEIYSQVNHVPSESERVEEKILALVASKGEMTARDMARHIRGKSATDLAPAIKHLVRFGELAERCTKRTSYFCLPKEE